jgi:uncharacterized SAM-binding protein YcdF (DUF218 family)
MEHGLLMFVLLKIVGFLTQPSTLVWVMLIVGLTQARSLRPLVRQQGLRLASGAAGLLLLVGVTPVSSWIMMPLEERFPRPEIPAGSRDYAGIIVLGGGEDGRGSVHRRQLQINEAGDRITTAAGLAVRLPDTRLILTGTAAPLFGSVPGTTSAVRDHFLAIGIDRARIVLEEHSRNTYENATLTHALVAPKRGERFLLVTSAAHMPRAVGAFRRAGFDVVAYPTDYRTNYPTDLFHTFGSMPAGLKRFDEATKEWIGLIAYRLLGRSASFFPGAASGN